METQTERLVQGNEGSSLSSAATEEQLPSDIELVTAGALWNSDGSAKEGGFPANTPFVNPDSELAAAACAVPEASGTSPVEGDQVQEPGEPEAARAGASQLPPELQPDKDGNPPELTESLLRKLRGRYFTVRHVFLKDCGHKLDMINQPKNNCDNCWFQFFNTHGELVQVADQFYRTHGKNAMEAMRGKKFVKNFGRFMVTVLAMKAEEKANESGNQEGRDASSIDGTAEASQVGGEGNRPADEQGGQAESRGISSGLIEQAVRD